MQTLTLASVEGLRDWVLEYLRHVLYEPTCRWMIPGQHDHIQANFSLRVRGNGQERVLITMSFVPPAKIADLDQAQQVRLELNKRINRVATAYGLRFIPPTLRFDHNRLNCQAPLVLPIECPSKDFYLDVVLSVPPPESMHEVASMERELDQMLKENVTA